MLPHCSTESNRGNLLLSEEEENMSAANTKPKTPWEQENSGSGWEMWTPADLKVPGWVTSAWPKPTDKLFKEFFSGDI